MTAGQIINRCLKPLNLTLARIKPVTPIGEQAPQIELDPTKGTDDYNWKLYHLDYSAQIAQMASDHTQKLTRDNAQLVDGVIKLTVNDLPLHRNHSVLYETVAALAPVSAIEVGCGGGDHLNNLSVLLPQLDLRGFDRSVEQLTYLKNRSPALAEKVSVMDITLPPSNKMPQADVVYTQAVIMHIQAGSGHLVALSNLFRMARKCVVLMENFKRHNFVADTEWLKAQGMIDWDEIHFYVRNFEDQPHILIASKTRLNLEPLGSYKRLVDAMG